MRLLVEGTVKKIGRGLKFVNPGISNNRAPPDEVQHEFESLFKAKNLKNAPGMTVSKIEQKTVLEAKC